MKVQVKRAFKGYFLSPKKNNKKADRLYIKFSSTFNTRVQRCLYPLFQNQRPHFLLLHLSRRLSQPSGQMLNEHMVDYHPSLSEFTSRIHPLIYLRTLKGFISPEYLIFFSNLHIPPGLKKMFQIHGAKITWKYTFESKNRICSFSLMPQANPPPPPQAERNYPFHPNKVFWKSFFLQQRGRGLWSWKYDQN